jgi:hypothetical protein
VHPPFPMAHMHKVSELVGKPIVSAESGEQIDKVADNDTRSASTDTRYCFVIGRHCSQELMCYAGKQLCIGPKARDGGRTETVEDAKQTAGDGRRSGAKVGSTMPEMRLTRREVCGAVQSRSCRRRLLQPLRPTFIPG